MCDIDGSITNNIAMPALDQEINQILKPLWIHNHGKMARLDLAFKQMERKEILKSERQGTIELRQKFFKVLDYFCDFLGKH